MPMASSSPYSSPRDPPSASPPTSRIPLSNPSNNTVFTEFIEFTLSLNTDEAGANLVRKTRLAELQ